MTVVVMANLTRLDFSERTTGFAARLRNRAPLAGHQREERDGGQGHAMAGVSQAYHADLNGMMTSREGPPPDDGYQDGSVRTDGIVLS